MIRRWLVFFALTGLLSGCVVFKTHVTAFHNLENPTGVTYVMVPFNEQQGSIEHSTYAKLVGQELQRYGMIEVAQPQDAKVAVFIRYGIDNGRQVVSSYPIMGQTGVTSSTTTGTISSFGRNANVNATTTYSPTYGIVGTGVSSDTEFTRFLEVEMLNMESLPSGNIKKLYEAKARSTGSSSQLARVMPHMVKSVFKEFPGTSGKSRSHTMTGD